MNIRNTLPLICLALITSASLGQRGAISPRAQIEQTYAQASDARAVRASASPPSSAVALEEILNAAGFLVPSTKNRFLSFSAGDLGLRQAIRVTLTSLPAQFAGSVDWVRWVGPPFEISEAPNAVSPGGGAPTFAGAELQCTPHFQEWHVDCVSGLCEGGVKHGAACIDVSDCLPVVHVFGPEVVPGAGYRVEVIEETCDLNDPADYSPARLIQTSIFGDIAAPFDTVTGQWPAPDGLADQDDIDAILEKFSNVSTAPIKARCDLAPETLNLLIGTDDLVQMASAAGGGTYSFDIPCCASQTPVLNPDTADAGSGSTSRFISFLAGDRTRIQAIRVTLPTPMPDPYGDPFAVFPTWDGLPGFVQPPTRYCENSGQTLAPNSTPPHFGCDPAPGVEPPRWYLGSTLQEDSLSPLVAFWDWHGSCNLSVLQCVAPITGYGAGCQVDSDCDSSPGAGNGFCGSVCIGGRRDALHCTNDIDCRGPVYVFHEGIIPSTGPHNSPLFVTRAKYSVQVIDSECDVTVATNFSSPLVVTTSKWGDTVLNTVYPFPPPEGIIQITDVLAILAKFQNLGTATISARVDLIGASSPKYLPDHGIDIGDVLQALFAFQAIKYPPPAIPGVPNPRPW